MLAGAPRQASVMPAAAPLIRRLKDLRAVADAAAMRTLLFVALAVVVPLTQEPPAPAAATGEPPLRLNVIVDGVEQAATDGQELTLAIGGKETRVKIVVGATRTFRAASVEFEFLRAMGWSHDASSELETWTLDGDDVTLILHRFRLGKAAEMAEDTLLGMLKSLDANAAAPETCTTKLGGKDHAGLRGRVKISASNIETTAIGIERARGCLLLMIQDSLGDDGKRSAECTAMLELLEKTFVLGDK